MSKRILVVDDSPIIHRLLGRAITNYGYTVCGDAKNGREAVEMYDQLLPDCVMMDVTMPVMNGMDATREIKRKYPESKIIMLTAMGDTELMAEAKLAGVDVFLKKPFDDEAVTAALATLLH